MTLARGAKFHDAIDVDRIDEKERSVISMSFGYYRMRIKAYTVYQDKGSVKLKSPSLQISGVPVHQAYTEFGIYDREEHQHVSLE